jgi:hypothetical protein
MMIKQLQYSTSNFIKSALMLGLLGMCQSLVAQNLQFGKTKLIESKTDTVPKGKVWKVESFIYSKTVTDCPTGASSVNISDSIAINGNKLAVRVQRFSGLHDNWRYGYGWSPEFFLWEQKTPMWFPAGTTLATGRGVLYISVLEFNDIP